MENFFNKQFSESRRSFLRKSSLGFGSIALSSMLSPALGMAKKIKKLYLYQPFKFFLTKYILAGNPLIEYNSSKINVTLFTKHFLAGNVPLPPRIRETG